jgi:hypothetical protein
LYPPFFQPENVGLSSHFLYDSPLLSGQRKPQNPAEIDGRMMSILIAEDGSVCETGHLNYS